MTARAVIYIDVVHAPRSLHHLKKMNAYIYNNCRSRARTLSARACYTLIQKVTYSTRHSETF